MPQPPWARAIACLVDDGRGAPRARSRLLRRALALLWRRAHRTLSEVTLDAIFQRVLWSHRDAIDARDVLPIDAVGASRRRRERRGAVAPEVELASWAAILGEVCTIVDELTGGILTPGLVEELLAVATAPVPGRMARPQRRAAPRSTAIGRPLVRVARAPSVSETLDENARSLALRSACILDGTGARPRLELWGVADGSSERARLERTAADAYAYLLWDVPRPRDSRWRRTLVTLPIQSDDRVVGVLCARPGAPLREAELGVLDRLAGRLGSLLGEPRHSRARREPNAPHEDRLLAMLAHDLQNPLSALRFHIAHLRAGGSLASAATRTTLGAIDDLLGDMSADLREALELAHGTATLTLAPHDVTALVARAVDVVEPLAAARAVTIEVECVRRERIVCDRPRTLRVLANLLANAVRFSPRGGHVAVRSRHRKGVVELIVRDEGAGLPESAASSAFDYGWQAAPCADGSGLGLYIARTILRAHGGELRLDETRGKGAVFVISFGNDPQGTTGRPARGDRRR